MIMSVIMVMVMVMAAAVPRWNPGSIHGGQHKVPQGQYKRVPQLYCRHPMKLSVVIPVCNEAASVGSLVREIQSALAGSAFEIIFVDDGSTDGTSEAVCAAREHGVARIRLLRHAVRCGQSAAVWSGAHAARGEWIATLDGDGQNDPADIPVLRDALASADGSVGLVIGHRIRREDAWLRRVSSYVANAVRGRLLHDGTPDAGCGIKLMHRATFLALPAFDHMHRFLPVLFQRAGAGVMSVPVRHRPRASGVSKYGLHDRLWGGIVDLLGVRWLVLRSLASTQAREH